MVRPQRPGRSWPQLLGFPLAVLVLGVALGVIAVVMLVAAGAPAPWALSSIERPRPSSSTSGQPSSPVPALEAGAIRIADGLHLVGPHLRPGRYVTSGSTGCRWARLRDSDGIRTVVAEGSGTGPTVVRIRKADAAFRSTGCPAWTAWTRR